MQKLQNYKKIGLVISLALVVAIVVGVGITLAMQTSATESRANIFSLGDVSITLDEPEWEKLTEDDKKVSPGKELPKDPQITNTGDSTVYAYLEIRVPKANTRIVNSGETLSGYAVRELFIYTLNSGWQLINTNTSGQGENVYIYGYTTALQPGATTMPLFSKVQFANIVEGDVSQGTRETIDVIAHAIQSDYLNVAGSTDAQRMAQAWPLYQAEPQN